MARHFGIGGGHHGRGKMDDEKTQPLKITDRRMLGWFYRSLAPHRLKLAAGFIAMLTSTGLSLSEPLVLKEIMDRVIVGRNFEPLLGLALLYLAVTVGSQVLGSARTLIMHLLGLRFVHEVRMRCYRHMMKLGMNYFDRQRSGDIMSRISNDVGAVETMVVHGTDDLVSNGFHVTMAVAVLFWYDWRAALIALIPLPLFIGGVWSFARYIRPVFKIIRKELGEINVKLQERIAGIRVIKAFAREPAEIAYFEESSEAYWKASSKSTWMWTTFFPAIHSLTAMGLAGLIYYCGWRGVEGTMTVGMFYVYHRYMQRFYRPIGSLTHVQNLLNNALASLARIFELFDEVPSIQDKEDAMELGRVTGKIELVNVSFRYDTGEAVLRNVSVTAKPGETVAVVGRSGAGKTSLVNLIPRFYEPFEGAVRVDGHDIRDVTQTSLRKNIAMVLQETFLFNTSIKENIRYARPEASDEEITAAAKAAYAHDFIAQFKDGYDSLIGERGVKLSGGEKQRLAIARAFLADPRILILDEATSMVDTEAEQIIQLAFTTLMQGRTVFVIAHRLSTVRRADKIVVIDDGQVVEQDRHEELMAKNGLYREMFLRQFPLDLQWEGGELTPDMLA